MANSKTKKKLKQVDINRNTSIEVSHTIRKIKENERKYTIILVIFFMIVISIIGFNILTINNNELYSNVATASNNNSYVSITSSSVTLTNNDIISDEDGIKTNKYKIHIVNNTNKIKQYKIYFVSDDKDKCKCGNNLFDMNNIHYTIDNKKVLNLEDNLFYEGILKKKEDKYIMFNMWIDNQIDSNSDLHLHGHFIIK